MNGSSTANNPPNGPALRAFVLAGGRSSRMGQDKARMPIHGDPLVQQMLAKLRALHLEPALCGSRPDLAVYAPVIADSPEFSGPLAGIAAALQATDANLNLILAVDLPGLPVEFLRLLVERAAASGAAATIPWVRGCPQPLCAVYHRGLLPGLRRSLPGGSFRVISAIRQASSSIDHFLVEQIAAAGKLGDLPILSPPHRWFWNLNTPQDAARYAASHPSNKLERSESAD